MSAIVKPCHWSVQQKTCRWKLLKILRSPCQHNTSQYFLYYPNNISKNQSNAQVIKCFLLLLNSSPQAFRSVLYHVHKKISQFFVVTLKIVHKFPSNMAWQVLVGDRKEIWPVKSWVLVCWWWWFDCSFACFISPVVTITSISLNSNKIQNGDILVQAYPVCQGKQPLSECCLVHDQKYLH